jgi:hypothetical protein
VFLRDTKSPFVNLRMSSSHPPEVPLGNNFCSACLPYNTEAKERVVSIVMRKLTVYVYFQDMLGVVSNIKFY